MGSVDCPFCSPQKDEILLENSIAYARYDAYPVNPGHILVIPFRHFSSLFEATVDEITAIWEIVQKCKRMLDIEYSPDGYNIGVNVGEMAGQTIMHVHIHLIPRYEGDIQNPRGGVRGVIPEKRGYP